MLKVAKFGGSSLASGEKFRQAKDIIDKDESRQIIVVSAPGRQELTDSKVTDLLYLCQAHSSYGVTYEDILRQIFARFNQIKEYCSLKTDIEKEIDIIRENIKNGESIDFLVSRGEYINAKLMAEFLGYTFVDSKDWLYFAHDFSIDYEKTSKALKDILEVSKRVVLPGFYGVMPNGKIHIFSRGGSDVTGAVAAWAVDADIYENFTDVSGILMADPRIVDNPKGISQITFAELRELSYMGAEVLHEDTVFPVRRKNIPLYIKNTNNTEEPGTLIMESFENESENDRFITGISGKKDFTIMTISRNRKFTSTEFIRRTLEILEDYNITVEHIPSSIDSFSIVMATSEIENSLNEVISQIDKICKPLDIKVDKDISLIAVVGRKMAYNPGVSGKIFHTLGENCINVRMIEQGSDEINIIIGVGNDDFEKTIRLLYKSFT